MATSQSEILARYRSLFDTTSNTSNNKSKKIDNLSFIDFLFEVIRTTKGVNGFKDIVLKNCLSDFNSNTDINDIIKKELFSLFGCDNNLIIPGKYTIDSVNGIPISRSEIDSFGLLKFDPSTTVGLLMYEGNDITKHINYFINKSQYTSQDSPLEFKYKGNVLFSLYAVDTYNFLFKFGNVYKNKKYSYWLKDYIAACNPIFNMVNFTTILTDIISGSISFGGNKSLIDINKNSSILIALQKIFGFCNESNTDSANTDGSLSDFLNNQNNNNQNNLSNSNTNNGNLNNIGLNIDYFNFTQQELLDSSDDANSKANGFIKFSTCGNLEVPVNSADVILSLNNLFNNSNTQNIIDYTNGGNVFNPTQPIKNNSGLIDNTINNPDINNIVDTLSNLTTAGLSGLLSSGEDPIALDINNINIANQSNILKSIPYAIMELIISPKVLIIPKTHSYLNGDTSTKDTTAIINDFSKLIYNIGDKITKKILDNIFNSIKTDLVKLSKDLASRYLKQRGIDYLACLTSLLSLLKILNGLIDNSGCQSLLSKLLALLKLANFGPMPTIPPPLVLLGGALKPGLNHVAIVNDIKSSLISKGIETSTTMPDGTPNNMMIAIEEMVKVLITHVKTNANISVTTTGVGLSQGYAQIQ